ALEAGRHDVGQYIADSAALGCTQLDLWNGHLPALLDQDGRVGTRAPAELPPEPEALPESPLPPDWLLLPGELALLDELRAAMAHAGLPLGCLAVDGAHLYEPTAPARALNRLRAVRWCQIAARLGAR